MNIQQKAIGEALKKSKKVKGFQKVIGLMFSRGRKPLLFKFSEPTRQGIHSLFVFFPFIAIWLRKGKVVEMKKVGPFSLHVRPSKEFDSLLEIPLTNRSSKI